MSTFPAGPPAPDSPGDPMHAPLGAGLNLADPNGPFARYYLNASQAVALIVLALIFTLLNFIPLWHTDIWGHIKYGAWIVQNRALPEREPYSPFTDKKQPLVHAGWLSQVGYHFLYQTGCALAGGDAVRRQAGGVAFLRGEHQAVVIALYAVMLLAFRRYGGSLRRALVGLVLLFILSIGLALIHRPQVHGLLGFAVLLLMLAQPLSWRRAVLGLPVLFVIWANLHGSFVIGLGLLGLTVLGRVLETRPFLRGVPGDAQLKRLLAALVVTVAAVALLNPHGPKLFLLVAQFGSQPNIGTIDEWQPVRFTQKAGGHWSYGFLLLAIVLTQLFSPRWFSPTQCLWLLVLGVGPLLQQRLLFWWLLPTLCVLVTHWAAIGERANWRLVQRRSEANFRKTVIAAVPLGLALLTSIPAQWLLNRRPAPLAQSLHPGTPWRVAAVLTGEAGAEALPELERALRQHYPGGRLVGPVFCSETQGDYLFWALPPQLPPVAYTHIHLFPAPYWHEFLRACGGQPNWRTFVDRWGANLIVIEPDAHAELAAAVRRDPDWIVVVDESGSKTVRDPVARHFIALRRQPLLPKPPTSGH